MIAMWCTGVLSFSLTYDCYCVMDNTHGRRQLKKKTLLVLIHTLSIIHRIEEEIAGGGHFVVWIGYVCFCSWYAV